jgi:hypothetical protein
LGWQAFFCPTPFDAIHVIRTIPNDSQNKYVACIQVDIKPVKFVNLTFVLGVVFWWFILGIGSLVGVARHKDAQGGLHQFQHQGLPFKKISPLLACKFSPFIVQHLYIEFPTKTNGRKLNKLYTLQKNQHLTLKVF